MTVGRSPRDDRKPRSSTAYRSNASPNSSPSPSPNTSPGHDARANEAATASTSTSTLTRPPRQPLGYSSPAFSSDSDNNNDHGVYRRAHSARDSAIVHATSVASCGVNAATTSRGAGVVAVASSSTATDYWKDDLSNLLTPQTVVEQAQVQRRKRNREAARRSRQKQKERERELVERQTQLSERLKFLEQELVEWRMMNANASNRASNTSAVGSTADSQLPSSPQPSTLPLLQQQQQQSPSLNLIDLGHVLGSEDNELAGNINHVYDLTMETLHIIGQLQLQLDEITKELNDMIGSSP
ncbi:hypothetical protein IW152_004937 [Coemansia sp. BCRC 34962]|nr:hypothetical protein IW152_004937 [Coemansia sp. BCRC 34962]